MISALDLYPLDRPLLEGFDRTDYKIGEEIDKRDGTRVFGIHWSSPGFKPLHDPGPGGFIRFVLVVCADMPDAKLPIAAVQVGPTVNRPARFRRLHWKGCGKCQ
jgi:hypothetical protein